MKIVIPGGSGQVGQTLAERFRERGDDVVVLGRRAGPSVPGAVRTVAWDGKTAGDWTSELDGADVVINLAGRNVNCRYNATNRAEMMSSRVDSTRAVGLAIARASRPPRVWLQMSTATIYSHRFDAANDEESGLIGGDEPDAPASWRFSVEVAKAWERTLEEAATPHTRRVAARTTLVLGPGRGGIFDVLLGMTRRGLGGAVAGGRQYISWIHERDFIRAIELLIERDELAGVINVGSPGPMPQREFMAALRAAWGTRVGLPATSWMASIGAFLLRSETELLFKSRRVAPARLLAAGFEFAFPEWTAAAEDLVARWRAAHAPTGDRQ